ncbi:MAG TPA: FkbM family methyltransferase [Gaiellaceae bacterium]|jgi:FkbM family methyltransferase|nr:FkbM family methyltransferase [Gaiellaceae bacterium]
MNSLLRLVRRLATMPGLRRLTQVDALMRISLSLRSSLVRDPWRFVWNELRPGRRVTATYRLKESGVAITIRHKSHDILILDEVFSQREYRFPEPVLSRLADRTGQSLKVADIGANIGLFGAWILGRFPEAEIVALEPDPANAELHRVTIEENGRAATWHLVEAGAMTKAGTVRFSIGEFARSHVARADEAGIAVEGVDVFPLIADVDLLKIDIEGAEWPILQDPRFGKLGAEAVVLEYHPEGSPGPEPARAAETLLAEAGFKLAAHQRKDSGTGVLWALSSSS